MQPEAVREGISVQCTPAQTPIRSNAPVTEEISPSEAKIQPFEPSQAPVHGNKEKLDFCQSTHAQLRAVTFGLLLPPASGLLFLGINIHGITVILVCWRRRISDLADDIAKEVKLLVADDGLLEMKSADALGIARFGFGGGFGDEGDHEEFKCFGYEKLEYFTTVFVALASNTYRQQQG
jgi:hypothetical protein